MGAEAAAYAFLRGSCLVMAFDADSPLCTRYDCQKDCEALLVLCSLKNTGEMVSFKK